MHATRESSLSEQVQLKGPLSYQRKSLKVISTLFSSPDFAKVLCVECYSAGLGIRGVLNRDGTQLASYCENLNDKDAFSIR
jgi:hypothetical protein